MVLNYIRRVDAYIALVDRKMSELKLLITIGIGIPGAILAAIIVGIIIGEFWIKRR